MNICQEAGSTILTWNDLLVEYDQPSYIPIAKARGIPKEF